MVCFSFVAGLINKLPHSYLNDKSALGKVKLLQLQKSPFKITHRLCTLVVNRKGQFV
jgi:hypothetical protein